MADLVMGAMGSLIPKLYELLKEEYNLQTGVKERISSLGQELEVAQAALRKVAQVPWGQLDEQVQLWARQVREASCDMEDVLDTFLVRVEAPDSTDQEKSLLKTLKKMTNLFKKSKARRKISGEVKEIMSHLEEVTKRCRRYKVDDIVVRPAISLTIDPRLQAMYNKVKNLVGIDKSSSELISKLHSPHWDNKSSSNMKIVSISGCGGLGKTTLAKAVFDKLIGDYDCGAFVPVGQNPDLKKVLKDILMDIDKMRYLELSSAVLDERQLINELHSFLQDKRYFIVIDDIWEIQSWETIKLAIDVDNRCGGRIIITTRKLEVAIKADEYKLQPLPYDSSRELFFTRISGQEGKYVHTQEDEISDKFIRKCCGIPLAIITMASLLAGKQREEWPELYKTIDFGRKGNKEAENTMQILSFSYNDMPSHLRTCLLYLSAFPEESVIPKDSLVWKWVAEGFVPEEQGRRLFEVGEGYFNDLINRSMIQAVESIHHDNIIIGCRVHDMVLDFISSISNEENFFTVLENDRSTLVHNNNAPRRIAYHSKNMPNHFDMAKKARSFIALECVIDTCVPLSSFKHLRVLAIDKCKQMDGQHISIEPLGNLLKLRFLSLSETSIKKIPKEIRALRFLQTLDLWLSDISEFPSSSCFPKQLLCLRIKLDSNAPDAEVFSVESLTCLEELSILVWPLETRRWLVKGLCSLKELRVIDAKIFWDVESERDFVESLRHLDNLQYLKFRSYYGNTSTVPHWQATELILSRRLRHLAPLVIFSRLPSCINVSSLPRLSHLDLHLLEVDEQDLKILGRLPELHFLELTLWSSATIRNVSDDDSDTGYFPKLRCLKLRYSMVLFHASQEDNSVSFSIWDGKQDISMPSVLQRRPLQPSNLQHGLAAATPRFMPKLQVLHFYVPKMAVTDPRYYDDIGLEYLSSLQEIIVTIDRHVGHDSRKRVVAALRHAAQVHLNHPTFRLRLDV